MPHLCSLGYYTTPIPQQLQILLGWFFRMDSSKWQPSLQAIPWGMIFFVGGILTIVISLLIQFSYMSHGASGQLTIDAFTNVTMWTVLTGVILLIIGFILWLVVLNEPNKTYFNLFLLTFSSYIISNIALMYSTVQVSVSKA